MKRQSLGNGSWFDLEKATKYDEATWWDGSNYVSKATGSKTEHECLYRTVKGKWVLNSWSQWQGTVETWEVISQDEAARWLSRNDCDFPVELESKLADLEI